MVTGQHCRPPQLTSTTTNPILFFISWFRFLVGVSFVRVCGTSKCIGTLRDSFNNKWERQDRKEYKNKMNVISRLICLTWFTVCVCCIELLIFYCVIFAVVTIDVGHCNDNHFHFDIGASDFFSLGCTNDKALNIEWPSDQHNWVQNMEKKISSKLFNRNCSERRSNYFRFRD